jgi:hypothetical protein
MSLTLDGLVKSLAVMTERKNKIFQDLHQAIGAASILEQLVQQLLNPPAPAEEPTTSGEAVMDSEPAENANGEAH